MIEFLNPSMDGPLHSVLFQNVLYDDEKITFGIVLRRALCGDDPEYGKVALALGQAVEAYNGNRPFIEDVEMADQDLHARFDVWCAVDIGLADMLAIIATIPALKPDWLTTVVAQAKQAHGPQYFEAIHK